MGIYAHIREGAIVSADPGRLSVPFNAALILLLVAGCSDTRGGPIPYDQTLAAPDTPSLATLESNYKIAPMDKLTVKVFKSEDISGDYDVDLTGHISLPLIGEVEAANMTTAELDQRLTEKLGEKYLEHPDVSVSIKQSAGRLVTIDGAVKDSGSFSEGSEHIFGCWNGTMAEALRRRHDQEMFWSSRSWRNREPEDRDHPRRLS